MAVDILQDIIRKQKNPFVRYNICKGRKNISRYHLFSLLPLWGEALWDTVMSPPL